MTPNDPLLEPSIPDVIAPADPTIRPSPRSGSPDSNRPPPVDMGPIRGGIPKVVVPPTIMQKVLDTVKNNPNAKMETTQEQKKDAPLSAIPPVAQASQATNPTVVPDKIIPDAIAPSKRPVEERMAIARDVLYNKLINAGHKPNVVTIRLDVTTSGGIEFIIYASNLPDTSPPTRYGTLAKCPTITSVEKTINDFVP